MRVADIDMIHPPIDFDSVVYYFGHNKGWLISDGAAGYALVLTDDDHLNECIISETFDSDIDAKYFLKHEADFYIREDIPDWKLSERSSKWWNNRTIT